MLCTQIHIMKPQESHAQPKKKENHWSWIHLTASTNMTCVIRTVHHSKQLFASIFKIRKLKHLKQLQVAWRPMELLEDVDVVRGIWLSVKWEMRVFVFCWTESVFGDVKREHVTPAHPFTSVQDVLSITGAFSNCVCVLTSAIQATLSSEHLFHHLYWHRQGWQCERKTSFTLIRYLNVKDYSLSLILH